MQMLNEKFEKIRQELRRRWLVLSVTLVAMDSACALLFFNLFHFREQTAVYTLVAVVLLEILFLALLFVHSVRRPNAVALAKLVEGVDPSYQNGLVCAVEKTAIPESERTIFEQLLVEDYQADEKISEEKIRKAVTSPWLRNSALIGAVILTIVLALFGSKTTFLRKAAAGLTGQPGLVLSPQKLQTPIYSDFTVEVEVLRWEKEVTISFVEEGEWVSYPMNSDGSRSRFTFYNLTKDQPFVVSTDSLISDRQLIEVFTPPKVENVTIEVVPPSYTQIKPTKTFSFNNLTVLEGSEINVSFAVKPKGCQSKFLLNKRGLKSSEQDDQVQLAFQLSQSSVYQVALDDQKGHVVLTPVYSIEVIPDQAPAISVIKPGRDSKTEPSKALPVEVTGADDFGIQEIILHTSIAGKERQEFSYQLKGTASKLKIDFKTEIDPEKLGAKNGDVIKYYFTIQDNREPKAQISRSDIFFLTVFEKLDEKKMKSKAKGKGKPKKVKIAPLLAEIKRLIRLSHDTLLLNPVDQKSSSIAIAQALADLKIKTKKLIEDIEKDGPIERVVKDAFSDVVKYLEVAEQQARLEKVKPSIPNQEIVLNKLSFIVFELSKNQTKSESESKEPCESSDQSKDKPKNKNQLKMDLAKLKKALKMLQQQSQAQGKQNRQVKSQLGSRSNQQELKDLKQKQAEISSKIDQAKKMMGLPPEDALAKQLDRASEKSSETENQLNQFRANQALREGQQTQKELLKAASSLEDKIVGLVKQALDKMAKDAKDLAGKQGELSKKSGGLKRSDQAGQKRAKSSQQEFKKALNALRGRQQAMAQHTSDLYPKLSEKLFKGLAKLNQSKVDSSLKKVDKAMRYKQFKNAAKYQMKVSKNLEALSKDLETAKLALPKITNQELMKKLDDLAKMQKSLNGKSKPGLNQTQKALKKMIDELAKKMDSKGMGKLQQVMKKLATSSSASSTEALAYDLSQIIGASMQEVMARLLKSELDEKIKINKKTFKLPEQYRDSIEAYFKKLSE